jgi:hypothetical protein
VDGTETRPYSQITAAPDDRPHDTDDREPTGGTPLAQLRDVLELRVAILGRDLADSGELFVIDP